MDWPLVDSLAFLDANGFNASLKKDGHTIHAKHRATGKVWTIDAQIGKELFYDSSELSEMVMFEERRMKNWKGHGKLS